MTNGVVEVVLGGGWVVGGGGGGGGELKFITKITRIAKSFLYLNWNIGVLSATIIVRLGQDTN